MVRFACLVTVVALTGAGSVSLLRLPELAANSMSKASMAMGGKEFKLSDVKLRDLLTTYRDVVARIQAPQSDTFAQGSGYNAPLPPLGSPASFGGARHAGGNTFGSSTSVRSTGFGG